MGVDGVDHHPRTRGSSVRARVLAMGVVILAVGTGALSEGSSKSVAAEKRQATVPPESSGGRYTFGINARPDRTTGPKALRSLGASLARVEWQIGTPTAKLDPIVAAYAAARVRVQPLAGFAGRIPSSGEAESLRAWARRYGPQGSFWRSSPANRALAIQTIEFGNETSYGYQYGDSSSDQSYADRAATYALRAKQAATALRGTGVRLLVQGEDGGSADSVWVDRMFDAVPDLAELVAGWTVHPYGPDGMRKIDRMLADLARRGVDSERAHVYITEWGLASDNGRALDDNYGYAEDMTFDQAAQTLADVVETWRSTYGEQLAQIIIYQDYEARPSGASRNREHYFGVLRAGGGEKGAYTREVRLQVRAARR